MNPAGAGGTAAGIDRPGTIKVCAKSPRVRQNPANSTGMEPL